MTSFNVALHPSRESDWTEPNPALLRGTESGGNAPSLQTVLVLLVAEAESIDVRAWEDAELGRLRSELPPQVGSLLTRGIDLLGDLLGPVQEEEPGQAGPGGTLSFLRRVDQLVVREGADERLADLVFIARGELRAKLAALPSLATAEDRWRIISTAGSGLRQLVKALTAIEALLAEGQGRPSALGFSAELHISLAVRRTYVQFRRLLESIEVEGPDGVCAALRRAATRIALLFDLEVYRDLRSHDRVELRRLQERILAWHRGKGDAASGLQLWQDVLAVAHLLDQVNHREELRVHDLAILTLAREPLRAAAPLGPVPKALRTKLASLFGRDDELDALVAHPGPIAAHDLLERVETLARQLGPRWSDGSNPA